MTSRILAFMRLIHADAKNLVKTFDALEYVVSRRSARRDLREKLEAEKRRVLPSFANRCACLIGNVTTSRGPVSASTLIHSAGREQVVEIGEACVRAIGRLDENVYGGEVILHEIREVFVNVAINNPSWGDKPICQGSFGGYKLDDSPLIDTEELVKKAARGGDAA